MVGSVSALKTDKHWTNLIENAEQNNALFKVHFSSAGKVIYAFYIKLLKTTKSLSRYVINLRDKP